MNDTPRDERAIREYAEGFASNLVAAGMARMPARVFAALLVTDGGSLTAAELAETLQASPAAISGAVRYLTQVDMIRRDREPGSRRDVFRLYDDIWDSLLRRRDAILRMWAANLREGAAIVGAGSPAGKRMSDSAEYFEFVHRELPGVLDAWARHKEDRAKKGLDAAQ
ncbi:GbsR/MarR family transcriptional regulator [Actinorhabdospora filicis]|nr:MarR family transcriptional regulator [Actinorhabdospora filicis]